MKKTILIITLLLTTFINSNMFANEVENPKFECSIENIYNQIDSDTANVNIYDISINFAEGEGPCTVSVSISYNGASATFSVTADTCEEAGAGAVEAAVGFVKKMKEMM